MGLWRASKSHGGEEEGEEDKEEERRMDASNHVYELRYMSNSGN
jgi:hypothetical protein